MQQQLPAKVSVKGDVHTIALLGVRLTGDSVKDVRLAAVPAIGQVSANGDAQTIVLLGARFTDDSKDMSIWPHLLRVCQLAAVTAIGQVAERTDPEAIKLSQASLCHQCFTRCTPCRSPRGGLVVGLLTLFLQTVCYRVKETQDVEKALKGILVISTIPMTPVVVCCRKLACRTPSTWAMAMKM